MKLVSVEEMKAIEQEADRAGLTYEKMMANAGRGLAEEVRNAYSHEITFGVTGLIGSGNNGGDTLVALAHLGREGIPIMAYIVRERPQDDPLLEEIEKLGGSIAFAAEDKGYKSLRSFLEKSSVLLDGVLGTGVKLPLREEIAKPLELVKSLAAERRDELKVVAVDCPSGMDLVSGEVAPECIPANLTVCMAAVKTGMLTLPAFEFLGELRVVDIGLTDQIASWKAIHRFVADAEMIKRMLPPRPASAHKGTFGTALVVAGSTNYTGAALLAGKAAYRIGAGLVTLAVPTPLHSALAGEFPEATWLLLPHELGVIAADADEIVLGNLDRITAMLIGPGWGLEKTTQDFLERLLDGKEQRVHGTIGFVPAEMSGKSERANLPPLVVDADGLKLLARLQNWHKLLPSMSILTPHPGEMSILCGMSVKDIQADRISVAKRFAEEWGHIVVLKGAFTVIAKPTGEIAVIPIASAALARAGTGDVLAGTIVGLRAQGVQPFEAAVAGAWIHGEAGLSAARELRTTASVLAGDVLANIPRVLSFLERDPFRDNNSINRGIHSTANHPRPRRSAE